MAAFDPPFAALRALHAGGAMVLFGELVFARLVLDRSVVSRDALRGHVLAAAWLLATLAWLAWLVLETAAMAESDWKSTSGLVPRVLAQTSFGHLWLLRAALLLALGVTLAFVRRAPAATAGPAALAGLVLATLAWAGHANAQSGLDGDVHHLADALHALAAGAWIGSLRPLAACLGPGSPFDAAAAARTVARYGKLGFACVAVLVGSGIVNAAYTLGAPARLFDSDYGRLLLAKLFVFASLLAIAAVNRWRLTPAMTAAVFGSGGDARARAHLRRLAWVEAGLGVAIVALAGALGSAAPPMSR